MSTKEEQEEFKKKLEYGLDLAFKRLLKYKKQKNSALVISHNGKIIHVKPEWFENKGKI